MGSDKKNKMYSTHDWGTSRSNIKSKIKTKDKTNYENTKNSLYEENLSLKTQYKKVLEENKRLKDKLRVAEREVMQKSQLMKDLTDKIGKYI